MKVQMIAVKPMRYATRRLLPGDEFVATKQHAKILQAIGKATKPRRKIVALPPIPPALKNRAMAVKTPVRAMRDPDGNLPDHSKQPGEDLTALRAEYQAKVGRRPFGGWGAEELRKRMAEAE